MEVLQFGNLSVRETEDGVSFDSADSLVDYSQVNTAEVPVLISFLKDHLKYAANRRSSWRLSLHQLVGTDADDLQVTISKGQQRIAAGVLDISLTGMFLELDEPVGERGDAVEIDVSLGQVGDFLSGVIVRLDPGMTRVAVHFPNCIDNHGGLCPPLAYKKIFHSLEQIWLDKKLGLEWS